jgi:hypothetical protein
MHGLIFETSIYYWQDQPDNYPDGTTTNTARVRTVLLPAAPHRKRPQGPPFVSKVFTVRARWTLFTTHQHSAHLAFLAVPVVPSVNESMN